MTCRYGTANPTWNLQTDGFMSATLEVDAAPNRDGMGGRIVVGQIHGQDDESVNFQDSGGKNAGLAQVLTVAWRADRREMMIR